MFIRLNKVIPDAKRLLVVEELEPLAVGPLAGVGDVRLIQESLQLALGPAQQPGLPGDKLGDDRLETSLNFNC